jgi:hypothetical protein
MPWKKRSERKPGEKRHDGLNEVRGAYLQWSKDQPHSQIAAWGLARSAVGQQTRSVRHLPVGRGHVVMGSVSERIGLAFVQSSHRPLGELRADRRIWCRYHSLTTATKACSPWTRWSSRGCCATRTTFRWVERMQCRLIHVTRHQEDQGWVWAMLRAKNRRRGFVVVTEWAVIRIWWRKNSGDGGRRAGRMACRPASSSRRH